MKSTDILRKTLSLILILSLVMVQVSCGKQAEKTSASGPVLINIWTYYSDEQKSMLDGLIDDFNQTVGKEKGIVVKQEAFGSSSELDDYLLSSVKNDAGSYDTPDMFITYRGVDSKVRKHKELIDFYDYYTDDEIAGYVDEFIEMGIVRTEDGEHLNMFPLMKSTSIMMINSTDFARLRDKIDIEYSDLKTYEGILETARKYYEYTDSMTEKENDGKALFGIDSVKNYFLLAVRALEGDLLREENGRIRAHLSKETARKIWDMYYIPMVNGYFTKESKYATQDIKVGNALISLGSTAGTLYFPKQKYIDDRAYDIEMKIMPTPYYEDGESLFALQGGGVFAFDNGDLKNTACVDFIKWLTKADINTAYAINAGYLPVTKEAFSKEFIENYIDENELSENTKKTLLAAYEQYHSMKGYAHKPVKGYDDIREIIGDEFDKFSRHDAKMIREKLDNGADLDEVLESYTSDEYFDMWYDTFVEKLNTALEENK